MDRASGKNVETILAEMRAANERLLVAGVREQELADEARRLADALAHQALHDGLTGLPNRALFGDRLQQAVRSAHRANGTVGLLFIDLDGFKDVNDRLGHHAGDLLLQQVAGRLRATLRETDTAARLGGDEFVVLLPELAEPAAARHAAHRILDALVPPCLIQGVPQQIGASIGIAHYPTDAGDADALLRRADAAMYAAKRTRNTVVVAGFDTGRAGGTPRGSATAPHAAHGEMVDPAVADIRAANEQLLVAGLREQELADQLRRQLAFTAMVTANLGEGICAVDGGYRFTFVNPAATGLLGRPETELLGHDARGIVPVHLANVLTSVIAAGIAHRDDDAVLTRRDGTTCPVAYTAAPIIANGAVTGVVVGFRDITERKRLDILQRRVKEELAEQVAARTADLHAANERLRERETRLRLLLEQTPAAIWTLDTALRFTFAAGALLAALKLTSDQLVGLSLREFLAVPGNSVSGTADASSVPIRKHRRALAGKPTRYEIAWREQIFQVYIEPLRDPHGTIIGTIGLAHDITELSRRRRHDEFIATVSHQLLTPLAAARAGIGMLEAGIGDKLASDDRRLLGNIGRNVGRLGIHLNDLITLNQLKSGTLLSAHVSLDLRAVVADALNVVYPLLEEKGQELAVELPLPLPVAGDADELTQVMINLLTNAHRHTPAGTRVAIGGVVAGDEVILTVSDTGPGIPVEAREAIFRRFHRLAAPDTAGMGWGLGLAIVRGIIELHGGRAWVESATGEGSAFHLALPRAGSGDTGDTGGTEGTMEGEATQWS